MKHKHNFQFVEKEGAYYNKLLKKWVKPLYFFVCICGQVKKVYSKEKLEGYYPAY